MHHDTRTPDIESSSDDYAWRFTGPVGRYLLDVQRDLVRDLLGGCAGEHLRILEVGGGHAQLTPSLLAAGHDVVVHGSASVCARRVAPLMQRYPDRARFVASSLWSLPFADRAFDAVIGVRLLAHVESWEALLGEMARVCRRHLIVDFPPRLSANLFEPVLFTLKRGLEGNTRPFFCYRAGHLRACLQDHGFSRFREVRQLFLPMVLHRIARSRAVSAGIETVCRGLGLTQLLGAPSLLLAERAAPRAGS